MWGKHITLHIQIQFHEQQQSNYININTHSNEIAASFKQQLLLLLLERIRSVKYDWNWFLWFKWYLNQNYFNHRMKECCPIPLCSSIGCKEEFVSNCWRNPLKFQVGHLLWVGQSFVFYLSSQKKNSLIYTCVEWFVFCHWRD